MTTTKTCACCKEEKPFEEFGKNATTADGFSYYCRACNRAKQSAFRKANPAAAKAIRDRYLAKQRLKHGAPQQ